MDITQQMPGNKTIFQCPSEAISDSVLGYHAYRETHRAQCFQSPLESSEQWYTPQLPLVAYYSGNWTRICSAAYIATLVGNQTLLPLSCTLPHFCWYPDALGQV